MTLNPPKPEHTIYVVLQEYVGAGKRAKSKSLAVYNIPLEDVYEKIKNLFKEAEGNGN